MEDEELHNLLNNAYADFSNKKFDTAKEMYLKYVNEVEKIENEKKADDENWVYFNNFIEFYIHIAKEKAKGIEQAQNKIIYKAYKPNVAYLHLAIIAFEEQKHDLAIEYLDKSLKYNPEGAEAIFEKAENYKIKGGIEEYYKISLTAYDKIYSFRLLARYYRNLGYYFIEKEQWNLANAVYLYSLRFENSDTAKNELGYIRQKSGIEELPKPDELKGILEENNIPTYVDKVVLGAVAAFKQNLEKDNKLDTPLGKFVSNVHLELFGK